LIEIKVDHIENYPTNKRICLCILTNDIDVFDIDKDVLNFYDTVPYVEFAVVSETSTEFKFSNKEHNFWIRVKYKRRSETYRIINDHIRQTCGVDYHIFLVVPLPNLKSLSIFPEIKNATN